MLTWFLRSSRSKVGFRAASDIHLIFSCESVQKLNDATLSSKGACSSSAFLLYVFLISCCKILRLQMCTSSKEVVQFLLCKPKKIKIAVAPIPCFPPLHAHSLRLTSPLISSVSPYYLDNGCSVHISHFPLESISFIKTNVYKPLLWVCVLLLVFWIECSAEPLL